MIRALVVKPFTEGKTYYEFAGLADDTKPEDGVITGSQFREVDTGDLYLYDEEGGTWYKCPPDPESAESDPDNAG